MFKCFLLSLALATSIVSVAAASDYTAESTVAQFNGYIINGQTAQQVVDIAKQQAQQSEVNERKKLVSVYNTNLDIYKALRQEEEDQRNITAQRSHGGYRNVNPNDFMSIDGLAVHWFNEENAVLTCRHNTVKGVEVHANTIRDRVSLYEKLAQDAAYIENSFDTPGAFAKKELHKNLAITLAPFFEKKRAELLVELQQKEVDIKDFNCKVVVGQTINPLSSLLPVSRMKDVTCKTSQQCSLKIIEDEQHILQIACACGHAMAEHKLKYKDKEDKEESETTLQYR